MAMLSSAAPSRRSQQPLRPDPHFILTVRVHSAEVPIVVRRLARVTWLSPRQLPEWFGRNLKAFDEGAIAGAIDAHPTINVRLRRVGMFPARVAEKMLRADGSSCSRAKGLRAGRSSTACPFVGERHEGPILRRKDGQRLDRRTAHRWVRSIGKRDGLGVHPHMLRAGFIMAALDAGLLPRDVQIAARHADSRTTHDLRPPQRAIDATYRLP
jgi:hypothetical protein